MRKLNSPAQGGRSTATRTAEVDALLAALQTDEGSRQSPIYRWLDRHASELSARLSDQRINWGAFADHLASLGIVDGKGNKPAASVVRNTWQRVRGARGLSTTVLASSAPAVTVAIEPPQPNARTAVPDNSTVAAYPAGVQVIDGAVQEANDRLL